MNIHNKAIMIFLSYICTAIVYGAHAQALPPDFGRTHFIIGMSPDDIHLLRKSKEQIINENLGPAYKRAYFSPDDGLEKKLIELIDQEQQSMKIAVFQFTNIEIARAIKRAQERGVAIEIITDPLCLQDKFNKIIWLSKEGMRIYVYNPDANKATLSNKMHHKFVIFEKNTESKELVWIGSFNFTKSADIANQESVVVLDDKNIIGKFNKQYINLKERALKLEDFAKNHFIVKAWQPHELELKKQPLKNISVAHTAKVNKQKRNRSKILAVA